MKNNSAWKNLKNILCIRLDSMGDVIMTTPAFRAIKESIPGSHITLLTSSEGAAIAHIIPEIDETIICNVPWEKKQDATSSNKLLELIQKLKEKHFDAAIIFTVYTQNSFPSALLCYVADIPIRIAYCHKNPNQLLTNWLPDPEPQEFIRHEVERQLSLVELLDCKTNITNLFLKIPKHARQEAIKIIEENGVDRHKPWLVMHPGSASISRQYEPKGFSGAGRKIVNDLYYQIILTGTNEEQQITAGICTQIGKGAFDLADKFNLEQLAALISISPLLIANNTGPIHIAAALGTPVVDLYALTNPQHIPWQVPHRVLYFEPKVEKFYYTPTIPLSEFAKPLKSTDDIVEAARELLGLSNLASRV